MDELEKTLEGGKFKTPADIQNLIEQLRKIPAPQEFSNEVIALLMNDVLPCVFSAELKHECLELFETLEPAIPKPQIVIKDEVTKYTNEIQRLYDAGDEHWRRIWCLLLQILGSEIAHKDVINPFLKIVEAGFRSLSMQNRADSFTCWETLLEVFIKYNDIKKEKRVHLVLIPLKGSKAKTCEVANKKFDIWWKLIQALDDVLQEFIDCFENFVCFCFGPFRNDNEPLLTEELPKTFPSIRDKSIACLSACLGQPSELILKLGKSQGIDLTESRQVINRNIFDKAGKIIIAACVEVIPMIAQLPADNVELAHSIWMSLLCFIGPDNVQEYAAFIVECLEKLHVLPKKTDKKLLNLVLEVTTLVLSFEPITTANKDTKKCIEFLDNNWKLLDEGQILRLPDRIKTNMKNKVSPLRRSGRTPTKENNKKEDEFVVIPSVWQLNPEKLTEHQQERMRKRPTDIPALYNDMSQSQESCSIKPWSATAVPVIKVTALQNFGKEVTEPTTVTAAVPVKKTKPKSRSMKEIDRLKIDTVEGTPPINDNEKITTRRRSSSRSAKQKEPEWKKTLLAGKDRKGKKNKTENVDVKTEPQSSSDKGKSSKSPLKSSNQVEQTIKIEPTSPKKSPVKEPLKTPEKQQPQFDSEMIECSQDVTPTVNIHGRRSRTSSLATSPRRLLITAEPAPSPVTSPARSLRSGSISFDGIEGKELCRDKPTKMEISPIQTLGDVHDEATPESIATAKSPNKSPRLLRSGSAEVPISPAPEKLDLESRRSPRLSPKVDTSPDRPTRDTTRKLIEFKDDLQLVFDDTANPAEITSSPEQTVNKTSEFLNDTVNMSPILSLYSKSPKSTQMCLQERDEMNVSPTLPTKFLRRMESPRATVTVFQGRGAQMMSMLHKQTSSTPVARVQPAVPTESEPEMLTFTKTLPAPSASPSNSILKRKMDESLDDFNNAKRKRVSFHDPPVSVTKEYVPMDEEIRGGKNAQNRSLPVTTTESQSPNRLKYTLKRRGKRDSKSDLLTFRLSQSDTNLFKKPESPLAVKTDEPVPLSQESIISTASDQTSQSPNDSLISFKNRAEIFDFCFSDGNFETFLEKLVENGANFTPKANKIMAKALSNQMDTDSKLCYSILDRFSEKHAKEFLDHAMQENSTKDILNRISVPVLMNHVQERINADQEAKVELLKQLEMWFADPATITRQEVLTFFANSMPDEMTSEELSVILDELFRDKNAREIFDILTEHIRKSI